MTFKIRGYSSEVIHEDNRQLFIIEDKPYFYYYGNLI
jgi:hypothetical protein